MPPLIHDDESETETPQRSGSKSKKVHAESRVEADVHAKNQLKGELVEDIQMNEGLEAAEEEKNRVSPTPSVELEGDAGEDGDEDEEAYEVEAIQGHEWRGRKGHKVLLYNVKWKGYDETDNTLEPEENLISSRDLLAKYHHSIGGAPQPESTAKPSAKKQRHSQAFNTQDSAASATESPAPSAKRQKKEPKPEDLDGSDAEELFGSWVPKSTNWDSDIQSIETVERDQASGDLYILLLFKNGKKSRVKNGLIRKKAPQTLLNFYEAHLNFSVSSA